MRENRTEARRHVLKTGVAVAAGLALPALGRADGAESETALPTIKLGDHEITRFIAGWNPIGGHAHAVKSLSLHMQECLAMLKYQEGDFPESEQAAQEVLALPVYPDLTESMQDYVAETVLLFYG